MINCISNDIDLKLNKKDFKYRFAPKFRLALSNFYYFIGKNVENNS